MRGSRREGQHTISFNSKKIIHEWVTNFQEGAKCKAKQNVTIFRQRKLLRFTTANSINNLLICYCCSHGIGGSKGGRQGRAPPPLGPNFFNFMQFLGKFGKNNRLVPPPLQLAHPPLGNPGSATAWSLIQVIRYAVITYSFIFCTGISCK